MKRFHKITASCLLIAVVVGFSAFLYAVEISENDTVHAGRHNNQKKLVRDENGRIYLVYSHYDESEAQWKIYYTESDDGTTWNEPVSPWSDAYYYPSIAIDSSGNIHLVMVKSAGIYYSKKTSSWSSPEKVNTSGSSWTAPSIAVDSNKKPHIAWSQDSGGAEIFYSSRTSSGWCVPVNVSASSPTGSLQPQVLIDVENKIYIP